MARFPTKAWIWVSIAMILIASIGGVAIFFTAKTKVPDLKVDIDLTDQARSQILRGGKPVELSMQLFGYANARSTYRADGMNRVILSKEEVVEYRGAGSVIFEGRDYPRWLIYSLNEDGPFVAISGGYYDRGIGKSLYDCSEVFSKLSDIPPDRKILIRCDTARQ